MATEYNNSHPPLSEARKRGIIAMLMCFMPLMGMGIDLIAPSLPAINHALSIATACAAFILIGFSFYTWAIRAEEPVQAVVE
jgi:hypothetical protein